MMAAWHGFSLHIGHSQGNLSLVLAFRFLFAEILAPLKCHNAGRGTSVPTGNTDACGWSDCVSRTEPATVGTWRQTATRKGSAEATKQQQNL